MNISKLKDIVSYLKKKLTKNNGSKSIQNKEQVDISSTESFSTLNINSSCVDK